MRKLAGQTSLKDHAVLLLLSMFILAMIIIKPSFVSLSNANNILIDVSIYGVAAIAMTNTLPAVLADSPHNTILTHFLQERIDLERTEGLRLVA